MCIRASYPDITNGGRTAKAAFADESADIRWSSIYVLFTDPALTDAKVADYAVQFPYAKVADIGEYMVQTFGTTIQSIELAAVVAAILAPAIAFLITLLFMKMLVAREQYSIAVMKAIGFTSRDLRRQYFSRSALVLIVGLVAGTLLVSTLGEMLAGAMISSLGVSSFQMNINGWATWLASPLLIAAVVLLAVTLATAHIGKITISENIKEA